MKKVKKPKIKSVVFRGKRLPCGHFGQWACGKNVIEPPETWRMLPYVLEVCGKPPYKLTIEVR